MAIGRRQVPHPRGIGRADNNRRKAIAMIIWGGFWGGVLGMLLADGWEFQVFVGVLLGALAGASLRAVVRKEIASQIDKQPAIAYFHPWEFDPDQPRVSQAGAKARFRHYLNLSRTEPRLTFSAWVTLIS